MKYVYFRDIRREGKYSDLQREDVREDWGKSHNEELIICSNIFQNSVMYLGVLG
jgi:hypothetical protein